MAMPLLPEDKMEDTFQELVQIAEAETNDRRVLLLPILDYVRNYWMMSKLNLIKTTLYRNGINPFLQVLKESKRKML